MVKCNFLVGLTFSKISIPNSTRFHVTFFKLQKQPPEVFCNFIKKETLAQVFSCEFCEISKNNFFTERLWATASVVGDPANFQNSFLVVNHCWNSKLFLLLFQAL